MNWALSRTMPLQLNREKAIRNGANLNLKPEPQLQLNRTRLNGSVRINLMLSLPQKRKQTMSAYQANIIICPKREWHNQTL